MEIKYSFIKSKDKVKAFTDPNKLEFFCLIDAQGNVPPKNDGNPLHYQDEYGCYPIDNNKMMGYPGYAHFPTVN